VPTQEELAGVILSPDKEAAAMIDHFSGRHPSRDLCGSKDLPSFLGESLDADAITGQEYTQKLNEGDKIILTRAERMRARKMYQGRRSEDRPSEADDARESTTCIRAEPLVDAGSPMLTNATPLLDAPQGSHLSPNTSRASISFPNTPAGSIIDAGAHQNQSPQHLYKHAPPVSRPTTGSNLPLLAKLDTGTATLGTIPGSRGVSSTISSVTPLKRSRDYGRTAQPTLSLTLRESRASSYDSPAKVSPDGLEWSAPDQSLARAPPVTANLFMHSSRNIPSLQPVAPSLVSLFTSNHQVEQSTHTTCPVKLSPPIATALTTPKAASLPVAKTIEGSIAEFRHLQGTVIPQSESYKDVEFPGPVVPLAPPSNPVALDKNSVRPLETLNSTKLELPSRATWLAPRTVHRYMGSFGLLQKHVLSSALTNPTIGAIELIERESLGSNSETFLESGDGPDLILDVHSCVIFFPLAHLPASSRSLMQRIEMLRWRFNVILIVFEGYEASKSFAKNPRMSKPKPPTSAKHNDNLVDRRPTDDLADLYNVLSPPVLGALKRFKRELKIARELATHDPDDLAWSAMPSMDPICPVAADVEIACAASPEDAAKYARLCGDRAESQAFEIARAASTSSHAAGHDVHEKSSWHVWDDRSWLTEDETEVR
jgi:hypothetical protein